MSACLGDPACPIPPRASGYCRMHELMLVTATAAYESVGCRGVVETESDYERKRRGQRERARVAADRQRVRHMFDRL